ncbi:S1C family serine protease [Lichenihabitans sp. Uapishka_5]|uniref:S1C family serine protease n=1 Tax=Lichenihabitans sp. Uapishka_5 TaxID=3037302 RepID=UPI0029E7F672|nr:S1C family serine protease [Lichenihabitans sp. Uapishka_5]MDX7952659.1 S1C family serine protease [Lichenihabitans sp. Uapishka_5]
MMNERGTAHGMARDSKTDLAPLRLDAKPPVPLTTAVFRTTPLHLGEAVVGRRLPHCGCARQRGELHGRAREFGGELARSPGARSVTGWPTDRHVYDTTEFPMTGPVQPGNSGGPVLDGSGALLGVTVARMNDMAVLMATNSVPQTVNFGIKGDVAASFLRVNGVEPKTSGVATALPTPQIAAGGKAFTAQGCRQLDN